MILCDLLMYSAKRVPHALAIKGPHGSMLYSELDRCANQFARAFVAAGVNPGDRIGIWLEKSAYTVAAMQGALRLSAVYVPLDPLSPAQRICTILADCALRVLVTTHKRLEAALLQQPDLLQRVICLYLDDSNLDTYRHSLLAFSDVAIESLTPAADSDMAYILYTSGSTGKPKGVCISHQNALAFINWSVELLNAQEHDRFSSHAPFHFDLSVLDLYVAFAVGAAVCLIPDSISYLPGRLVDFLMQEKPTVWYSVPSVLVLMMEQGALLDNAQLSLHTLLYAGEPFPIKHLRRLHERWPALRIVNLYGPTETNVCTYYEIHALPQEMVHVPIGCASSGDHVWAQKEDGSIVRLGEQGELMVSGPTVMLGYWGRPVQGDKAYATGDTVRLEPDGNYVYVGRRDHMVKIRGHRVELGDIETALLEHAAIHEAAVMLIGTGMEARLVAFVMVTHAAVPSLLALKRHCAERLPRYMIIDALRVIPLLPRTRNGKIDRLALSTYASTT